MFEQSFEEFREEYLAGQYSQIERYSDEHKFYYFVQQGVFAASELLPAQIKDNAIQEDGGFILHTDMLPVYYSQLHACLSIIDDNCRKFVDWKKVFAGKDIARCFTKVDNSALVAAIDFIKDVYWRYRQGYISWQYRVDPRADHPDDEVVMEAHDEMWPRLEQAKLGDEHFWGWMIDVIDSMQADYPVTDWSYSRIGATAREVVLALDNEYERVSKEGLKIPKDENLEDWPEDFKLIRLLGLGAYRYALVCDGQCKEVFIKTGSKLYRLLDNESNLTTKYIQKEFKLQKGKGQQPSNIANDINRQLLERMAGIGIRVVGRKKPYYFDHKQKKYRFRFVVGHLEIDEERFRKLFPTFKV